MDQLNFQKPPIVTSKYLLDAAQIRHAKGRDDHWHQISRSPLAQDARLSVVDAVAVAIDEISEH